MDKDKVIDYVMNTPHNANRQVLEGMLNAEGGSGGDAGLERLTLENSDDRYYLKLSNGEYLSESNFDLNKVYIYNNSLNFLHYEAVSRDLNGNLVFVYAVTNPTGATLKTSTFSIGKDGRYYANDSIM